MRYSNFFYYLLFAGLLVCPLFSFAQQTPSLSNTIPGTDTDTTTTIEILGARKLELRKVNDSTQLQILAGNVRLMQGSTLFYSDSCVINNDTHVFEAWGHVHINDSDTADAYSNHLLYLIQKKLAYLDGAVRLTDGKGSLTTPDVEYNLDTKVGIYKHGGKVTTNNTVLTSKEGYYYTDLKDVYFKNNVELNDPAYYIKTDSLLYNTEAQTARFIAETFIRDSSGRTIETKEGVYNMQTGKAEFGRRPIVHDKNVFATGNEMMSDDSAGVVQFRGNAIIIDSVNQTTIIAGEIFINKKTNSFLAFKKPLMILKQENDSVYITADTLFSAKLTDLLKRKKSLEQNKKDSLSTDSTKITKAIPVNVNDISKLKAKTLKNDLAISDSLKIDTANTNKAISVDMNDSSGHDSDIALNIRNRADSLKKDTLEMNGAITINEDDSTNRYFEAYRNVRIFSDSMQSVCDSMFYSFQDSVFRLFHDPVVWSKESQITGDTILLYTKNKKADLMKVRNNSLLVNQLEKEVFNQVKSSRMDAYFTEGTMDSVHASGLAECIYFIQDEDSAYTGINESKSDILDAYFENKALQKVVFRSSVTGTIWPIRQKNPKEMRLQNFKWLEARRPKTKFELY